MKRIAVLGRTALMLRVARGLLQEGYDIPLVGTAPAAPEDGATVDDFKSLAEEADAVFFCDAAINRKERVAQLLDARCDIAVSVNWPIILKEEPIAAFPMGVLNSHAGDLPRYRGNACPNWAILMGETSIGLCIHEMAAGSVDSGDVILRESLEIGADTYIGDVVAWISERVPVMMVQAVNALRDGIAEPVSQPSDPALALRCYPRRPEDGRIDWRENAEAVCRLIRASSRPYPGAFSFLDGGRKVTVWRAETIDLPGEYLAVPGQILGRHERGVLVACKDGALCVTDITLEEGGTREQDMAALGQSIRRRLSDPS